MFHVIEHDLCRNTGEFMMSRYREVAEIVLRYLEHRDRLVRLSITSLLPRIAHFLRDRFVTNYLEVCGHCLLNHTAAAMKDSILEHKASQNINHYEQHQIVMSCRYA